MIVSCPNCDSRFTLPDGALGVAGRKMRCARCGHVWHQMPPEDDAAYAAPAVAAMEVAPMTVAVTAAAAPAAAAAVPAGDLPMEMEADGGSFRRQSPPDGGDLPLESGFDAPPPRDLHDDDTTDLDALADLLNQQTPDEDAEARMRDLDSLLDADSPDPIPPMFESPDEPGEKRRWPLVLAMVVIVVGGLGAGGWFGRHEIMATVPQTAGIYAALGLPVQTMGIGLRFQNVAGERVVEDGVDTLIVRGFIANISGSAQALPHLKLTLYDAEDKPIQSMVSRPPQDGLEPDSTAGFRLTLENPASAARRFEVDWTAEPLPGGGERAEAEG
ncbi:DUF3426 domain-containing protein [Caenispirillum bisanense]|uniref:DUF3426 domain-containing protein n=1 Tax=Caenispirillum bisanense TaxID=414052 RepID=UPI0031D45AD0